MTTLAFIGNLAGGDGLIIFSVILLLFGAKKLPELARGLGSAVREFSKAKDEIEHEITRPAPVERQIEAPKATEPYVTKIETEYTAEHAAADDEYHRRMAAEEATELRQTEEDQHRGGPAGYASSAPKSEPPVNPATPV